MDALNLPEIDLRLRRMGQGVQVWDGLRGKYVALTPEEWVRQHFVSFLQQSKGCPAALMANEVSLRLNGMQRRCDTVVYDRQLRPRAIVEYKRPSVKLGPEVFQQISRYNMVMRVDYLIVSNGLEHFCCRMDYASGTYAFLPEIPDYTTLTQA